MKKITMMAAMVVMMALPSFAERVTPETARKVATTFLNNNCAKTAQLTDLSKAAGFPNLYVFSTESSFVVMAADDCVKPILGYSLSDTFVAEGMPENIRGWLQGYNDEIQLGIENQMRATSDISIQWKNLAEGKPNVAKANVLVDALVQTRWNQNGIWFDGQYITLFNNLCPTVASGGSGGRAYVGCVATAMAQIMKYWELPATGIGSHSYTWNGQTLHADFKSTIYDWQNMTNTYSKLSTNEEKYAVDVLMYHCGVSVDMSYGGEGSSASTYAVMNALQTYFNYSSSMHYESKSDYTDSLWIDTLKKELQMNRPLQYRGDSNRSGHSFICDGYDSNDNFHFNWGWAGKCDGYYAIDNLKPQDPGTGGGNGIYTYNQAAIFGIQPNIISNAEAPTISAQLIQETGVRDVQLSWNKITSASAYNVYRNNILIYTTETPIDTSYRDVHIAYGMNTYFVRTVDASGCLSMPSNYETVSTNFAAPTNLTATQSSEGVCLSWSAGESAVAYNLYCNSVLIADGINDISYTDSRPIAGSLSYYVKGVDVFGDESDASDAISITVQYSTPIVNDLTTTISISGNDVSLSWSAPDWCYPQTGSSVLSYGNGTYSNRLGFPSGTSDLYWGQRFLASDLANYQGKVIYKVSFYASVIGPYECIIYTGTDNETYNNVDYVFPKNQVAYCIFSPSGEGWFDINLNETIEIDTTQDLWVFIHDIETKDYPASYCNFTEHTEGSYFSTNDPLNTYMPTYSGIAWLIRTYLTDGTYTYNLYDNESPVASNISDTTYMVSNIADNTVHQYTIKTNYYGGESTSSNKAGLALGNSTIAELDMDNNDKMTIAEGSTLTVTETLSNDNPENLILENGAQLFHSGGDVYATVKKDIVAYTTEKNGWNFIASPIATQLETATIDGLIPENEETTFDLYKYNEPDHKWHNYKPKTDNAGPGFAIDPKTGYLYASSENTTLSFAGKLHSASSITSNTLSYSADVLKGFNLVGNPLPFNAYVSKSYYKMNDERTNIEAVTSNSETVAPCTGIIVEATGENENVIFGQTPMQWSNRGQLQIAVAENKLDRDGSSTSAMQVDNAIICFDEADPLQKFVFNEDNAKLYIPQGDEDYAIACANNRNEMPLNFKPSQDGTFTLTVQPESVKMGYLFLIDNMTGTHINLLTTPNYTFEAKTGDYESRFKLLFAAENEETETFEDESFGFIINGQFQSVIGQGLLQVIDLNGRILRSANETECIGLDGLTAGVYVIRFITANSVRTQKIVVE